MGYYIGYFNDGSSRESCNVFYSRLIIANNEKDALEKWREISVPIPTLSEDDEDYEEEWYNYNQDREMYQVYEIKEFYA